MKRKLMTLDNAGFERLATTKLLGFMNMTDSELERWQEWFFGHNEQEYLTVDARKNFRVNRAVLKAEITWRETGKVL